MCGRYTFYTDKELQVDEIIEANSSVAEIHNRMPVVLSKAEINDWLFDLNKADDILLGQGQSLIKSVTYEQMKIGLR